MGDTLSNEVVKNKLVDYEIGKAPNSGDFRPTPFSDADADTGGLGVQHIFGKYSSTSHQRLCP